MKMNRCSWCSGKNPLYITYHDTEWGVLNLDDSYLFEALLLESFQAGLSFECVLNKRENFRKAFDNFDFKLIGNYSESKVKQLKQDCGIIRHEGKIRAVIKNAQIFISILSEYGSFKNYLTTFWNGKIIQETNKTFSELSEKISKDLQKKGMNFVGKKIIYSFLQAIGIVNSHEKNCFLFYKK